MSGKHAKKTFSARRRFVMGATITVGAVAVPATFAGSAHADSSIDCKDVRHQVDTSAGDPDNLDADGNGVGCEAYPGPPEPLEQLTGGTETAPVVAAAPADYIVQHGDNVSSIAHAYGVDLSALEALNPGIIAGDRPDDYSLIFAGGHVHLPVGASGGKHAKPPASVRTHHGGKHSKWYASCDAAPAGLSKGDPGYRHALDMDGDGKACEGPWPPAPPVTTPPVDTPPSDGGGSTTPPPPSDGSTVPVIAPDAPGTPSGYAAHSPSFWAPLIEQAMGLVGGNVNANHDVAGVEALMAAESGGDPNAINNYDSNAAAGTPSEGLMQVIQPTFDSYHVAGTSENLYDPLANISAALAYINAQYGGNIPSSPY